MKHLTFTICLVFAIVVSTWGQQSEKYPTQKTEKIPADFTLDDLYSQEQIDALEIEHPEKLVTIKSFFTTWDELDPVVKNKLVKMDMYRLFIRNREAFDNQLSELSN